MPLLIAIFSLAGILAFFRFQLIQSSNQFKTEFEMQNFRELAAGNTSGLAIKLNSLTDSIPWSCISIYRANKIFFNKNRGRCSNSFTRKQIQISHANNSSVAIKVTLTLTKEQHAALYTLALIQIVLLFVLYLSTKRYELSRVKQQYKMDRIIAQTSRMLAHDVRKPFRRLKAGLINLQKSKPSEIQSTIRHITSEVEDSLVSIEGMVDDLLNVEPGIDNLKITSVSLHSLLVGSFRTISFNSRVGSIKLNFDLKHTYLLNIDKNRINRVLSNILENALQAISGDGSLSISTKDHTINGQRFVVLDIHNSNSFIPKKNLERIFDSWFTSGKKNGTGLGLSICKSIIESHGGEIRAESTKETGTDFIFSLPCADNKDENDHDEFLNYFSKSGGTEIIDSNTQPSPEIIIIEDDVFLVDFIKNIFDSKSTAVFISPEDFFAAHQSRAISLSRQCIVITDYYFEYSTLTGDDIYSFLRDTELKLGNLILFSDVSTTTVKAAFKRHLPKDLNALADALASPPYFQRLNSRTQRNTLLRFFCTSFGVL
jgi:signal transduction histidine kinase